ncbi:hypothetical protein [Nocardioides sp.]|uniref:hypothetical protein n=1 Tax=Nocardioides sp. TaxID=35761 RepID=UPI0027343744|nr:hypothetical protein [Nocardioides sp.]MDP3893819.1 hypothetical protein [Nocardioides sp.]
MTPRLGRPSPAMVVAILALFVAMGGSAWAIADGEVKSRHIAKKAVKSKHIAPKAVKSKQLAPKAVTSKHLAPGATGLHQIPLRRLAPSATNVSEAAARAAAKPVVLFKNSTFTVYAKCYVENSEPANPGVHAEVFLQAPSGTVFDSDERDSGNGFIAAAETERKLADVYSYAGVDPGTLNIISEDGTQFWAAHGSSVILGDVILGTKVGSPTAGNGVFGPGNRCLVGGQVRAG